MHPIQDLFLEGFSYGLQIDMHFICTPMLTKFYSCKKWVLHPCIFRGVFLICKTQWLFFHQISFEPLAFLGVRFLFVKCNASFFIGGLFIPLHF
jgi:hypothetical protein